jgi:cholesterol transport system auxiliary component
MKLRYLAVFLFLTGCGGVLPNSGPAPDLFTLTPKSTFSADLKPVSWQLVVEEPVSAGALDSTRIAIQPSPIEIKYYSGARWSERAPRMVQTLLVESFENSGRIVAVGRQATGLRSDLNLKSELREFQAELQEGAKAPRIRVRLSLRLVRNPRQEIVASRNIEEIVVAKSGSMQDVVMAFDDALGAVLKQSVEWALRSGEAAMPSATSSR